MKTSVPTIIFPSTYSLIVNIRNNTLERRYMYVTVLIFYCTSIFCTSKFFKVKKGICALIFSFKLISLLLMLSVFVVVSYNSRKPQKPLES